MSIDTLLARIDTSKERIDERRPLSKDEARELDAYFKIGLTYSSNALEGNSLDLTETKVLLEDGITAGGKPIRDSYEATGHAEAYDFMLAVARAAPLAISEDIICRLHHLFYNRVDSAKAGRYRDYQVIITGTEYVPPIAGEIPALMSAFVSDLATKADELHPVLLAAFAHRRLVDIHPFADGNGRTARLLMNLILINRGYFIVSIPPVLRHEYIEALRVAQRAKNPDDTLFNTLIAECELETERDYGRIFNIPLMNQHEQDYER